MNKNRRAKKAIELGKYYTKKKQYGKGLEYFLKGISFPNTKVSKNGETYIFISLIYNELGNFKFAEKYSEMSKSVYRFNGSSLKKSSEEECEKIKDEGYKLLEKNKYKQALHKLLSVLDLSQGVHTREKINETIYYDIAYCYENLGDLENAYIYIQKALNISGGYVEGKIFLGNLLVHMGREEEGDKILKECEKIEEDIQNMPLDLDAFYGTKTA